MSKNQSNILKGLAIVAVVTIHSISDFIFKYTPPQTIWWQFYIALDQVCRFSVPVFVALSGYGLAVTFNKSSETKKSGFWTLARMTVAFYVKRSWKILPLFVFASAIIMLYRNFYESAGFDFLNYHTWTAIFRGAADYHLYFVPMIFRFYLLFPLFYFAVKKFPKLSLLAALVWQIFWYQKIRSGTEILGNWNQIWPDQMQYIDFRSWIFYFVLGIYLNFKNFTNFINLLLPVGLLWAIQNSLDLINHKIDWLVSMRFTRFPILIYASSFLLLFKTIDSKFIILNSLGKHSYFIYLFHTIVLRHLAPYHFPSAVLITLTLLITLGMSLILTCVWGLFKVVPWKVQKAS